MRRGFQGQITLALESREQGRRRGERHSPHAAGSGDGVHLIDVDLDEGDAGVLGAELLEEWRDALARSAPGRGEVDDDLRGLVRGKVKTESALTMLSLARD